MPRRRRSKREAVRVEAGTPFAYNRTVRDEKQKEGQDLRSKLTALGFTPEQDQTEEGRSVGMVGGVRKSSAVLCERKAQEPSAESSETTSSDTQTARSKLSGRFKEWGDDSTFIAFIGGVRKPSRIRDVTEELLEKGVGGLIVTGASKQRQD